MKRRSFIKYLAALPGLGFLGRVVAEPVLDTSTMIEGSIKLPIDPYLTDNESWFIKRPTTENAATKYISSQYGEVVRKVTHYAALHSEPIGLGLAAVKVDGTRVAYDHFHSKYDAYLIKGDGRTTEEAWYNFWVDFDVKVPIFDRTDKKIFWRRNVNESSDRDFDEEKTLYRIACRFSTAKI